MKTKHVAKPNPLSEANSAMRQGDYTRAVRHYAEIIAGMPQLRPILASNVSISLQRLGAQKVDLQTRQQLRTVFSEAQIEAFLHRTNDDPPACSPRVQPPGVGSRLSLPALSSFDDSTAGSFAAASVRSHTHEKPVVVQLTPARPRNPYYWMIPNALRERGWNVVQTISLDEVSSLLESADEPVVLHLHQLEPLYAKDVDSQADLVGRANGFLREIERLKHRGAKLVWTRHNPLPHDVTQNDIRPEVEEEMASLADTVVVLSDGARRLMNKALPESPAVTIPHPHFRCAYGRPVTKVEAREVLGLPQGRYIFGHIGEIKPYKGLTKIVTAFSSVRDRLASLSPMLVLAGRPDDAMYVAKLKASLPDQVLVHDKEIDETLIRFWLSALDASVFAFGRIWVSGSVVLSLSYRRPVVVPDIGFLGEYVAHGNTGVLYDPQSESGLSNAMAEIALSETQAHYRYMCDAFADDHSLEGVIDAFEKLYVQIVTAGNDSVGITQCLT